MLPEVPVTVKVDAPFVVPVYVEVELLLEPQLVSVMARATTVKHTLKASRHRGARRQKIMPAANSAARTAKIPGIPQGHGPRFEGPGGNLELDVPNVNCTGVPFGGGPGATGLGLNRQVVFDGAPTQLKVKFRPDPAAA